MVGAVLACLLTWGLQLVLGPGWPLLIVGVAVVFGVVPGLLIGLIDRVRPLVTATVTPALILALTIVGVAMASGSASSEIVKHHPQGMVGLPTSVVSAAVPLLFGPVMWGCAVLGVKLARRALPGTAPPR